MATVTCAYLVSKSPSAVVGWPRHAAIEAAVIACALLLGSSALGADARALEFRLDQVSAAASAGQRVPLTIRMPDVGLDDLSISATLITPTMDARPVVFRRATSAKDEGVWTSHFTPAMPGEYELDALVRGRRGAERVSVRRRQSFRIKHGDALGVRELGGALDMGSVFPGSASQRSVHPEYLSSRGRTVRAHLVLPRSADGGQISADAATVSPGSLDRADASAGFTVGIKVPVDQLPGLYVGSLVVQSEYDECRVPLRLAVAQPRLATRPGGLDLGRVQRGRETSAALTVSLEGGGKQPVRVTLQPWVSEGSRDDPIFNVEGLTRKFELVAGASETINVTVVAPEGAGVGKYHSAMVVESPLRTLRVPVMVEVIRPPLALRTFTTMLLAAIAAVLLALCLWDLYRALKGQGASPMLRYLLASALLHVVALLVSVWIGVEGSPELAEQRVAVRAVRLTGEAGLPGTGDQEAAQFLQDLAQVAEESGAVELAMASDAEVDGEKGGSESPSPAEMQSEAHLERGEREHEAEIVRKPTEPLPTISAPAAPAPPAPEMRRKKEIARVAAEAEREVAVTRRAPPATKRRPHARSEVMAQALPMRPLGAPRAPKSLTKEAVPVVRRPKANRPLPEPIAPEPPLPSPEIEARREPAMAKISESDSVEPDEAKPAHIELAMLSPTAPKMAAMASPAPAAALPTPQLVSTAIPPRKRRAAVSVAPMSGTPGTGTPIAGLGHQASAGKIVVGTARYAGDWDCDKTAMPNLAYQLERRVGLAVETETLSVKLSSPDIFKCALLFMSGHSNFRLRPAETRQLQAYLKAGGALWLNDSTHEGDNTFDTALRRELSRLLPGEKLEPVPMDSSIFTACYDLRSGYRGYDIPPGDKYRENRLFGIKIDGRWAIIYSRNDYGDGLEIDPNTHPLMKSLTNLSPAEMQEGAIRMGMNLAFYTLSSARGADEMEKVKLADMRRAASAAPEVEEQWRSMLAGRPSSALFQSLKTQEQWSVAEDWSRDGTKHTVDRAGRVTVKMTRGQDGKNVVGRAVEGDLSGYRWLVLDVESKMTAGARLAVGLTCGEKHEYFESVPRYVRPGKNPDVVFDLTAASFKSGATQWQYKTKAGGLNHVRAVHLLFYPISSGEAVVRSMKLVK